MSDRSPIADAALAADAADVVRDVAPGAPSASGPVDSRPPPPANDPPTLPVGLPIPMPAARPIPVGLPSGAGPVPIDTLDEEHSEENDLSLYLPSWLSSMVLHLSLLLLLALVSTLSVVRDTGPPLTVSADSQSFDEGQPEELSADLMTSSEPLQSTEALQPAALADLPATAMASGPIQPIMPTGQQDLVGGPGEAESLPGGGTVGALEMRLDGKLHESLLRSGGGTPESEEAVLAALVWLAEHQNYDGSWTFQHDRHPKCAGRCGNPGYAPGKIAATSMALLPFLGSGQTQHEGTHKRTIELALKFLVRSIQQQGESGSLWDPSGRMYGHGMASIALCEAYGMTHDPSLRKPAQSVVNFIVNAQDQVGGGWRYDPNMPGDTSVVGWQLMALKSAQMAYLRVPDITFRKAGYFLDSVQGENGAVYGYQRPDARRPATTAIGLLCRMYLGWPRNFKPLGQGVQVLATLGPSTDKTEMRNNMYYNYYATQVMHHWGGYPWQRWNAVMRDYLVRSQSKRGHERGSWYLPGSDLGDGAGGRLYYTALAAMTLEVYYRHMPLYRNQIASE
jgi:hypothetical protein